MLARLNTLELWEMEAPQTKTVHGSFEVADDHQPEERNQPMFRLEMNCIWSSSDLPAALL